MKEIWSSVYGSFDIDRGVVDACFQKMDEHPDGKIEKDEFIRVMTQFHLTKKRRTNQTPDSSTNKKVALVDVAQFVTNFITDDPLKGTLMHMMTNENTHSYRDTQRFVYSHIYSSVPSFGSSEDAVEAAASAKLAMDFNEQIQIHLNCCSDSSDRILDGLRQWNMILWLLARWTDPIKRLEKEEAFKKFLTALDRPIYPP